MTKRKLSGEELFIKREVIADAVHKLVDEFTSELTQEQDEELRQQLTEQFRFWRRR